MSSNPKIRCKTAAKIVQRTSSSISLCLVLSKFHPIIYPIQIQAQVTSIFMEKTTFLAHFTLMGISFSSLSPHPHPRLLPGEGGGVPVLDPEHAEVPELVPGAGAGQAVAPVPQLLPHPVMLIMVTTSISASKSSIRRFVITEKAPTRAFSWCG